MSSRYLTHSLLETALQSLGAPPVVVVDPSCILALLTCTLLFQVYTSVSSSVSIFPGGGRSVSIFFILYRSKVHLENEFQVAVVSERTPSRAATAIVIRNATRVTSEQEIYTPCQTATWEKSTGGAIKSNHYFKTVSRRANDSVQNH